MSKNKKSTRLLTLLLFLSILLLGMGIVFRLKELVTEGSKEQVSIEAIDLSSDDTGNEVSKEFHRLCRELEQIYAADDMLHINDMLVSPQEYSVWEAISDIVRINERELSTEEWLLHQKLEWCAEIYETETEIENYASVFSSLNGLLNKLPETFYTWHFENRDDIREYQKAMSQIPELMTRFAEQIYARQEKGICYSEETIQSKLALCKGILDEGSVFTSSFEKKINDCSFLSDLEKTVFIALNDEYVKKYVKEPYSKIIQILEELETSEDICGLCHYQNGKEYFEYLLKRTAGTDKTVDEIYEYLDVKRRELQEINFEIDTNRYKEQAVKSVDEMMEMLCQGAGKKYYGVNNTDYIMEMIPQNVDTTLYLAFYVRDSRYDKNYIYLNENAENVSWLEVYQTLAHETFPGHMYYYNYPRYEMYPRIQEAIKCTGYSEGWAVYAEFAAAEWLPDNVRDIYLNQAYQKLYDEVVLCQIDIGVNYKGWNVEEIDSFIMETYGYSNRDTAAFVRNTLVNDPGAYQAYVIGYFELEELMDKYCSQRGVPVADFIKIFQSCGQAPFTVVDDYLELFF